MWQRSRWLNHAARRFCLLITASVVTISGCVPTEFSAPPFTPQSARGLSSGGAALPAADVATYLVACLLTVRATDGSYWSKSVRVGIPKDSVAEAAARQHLGLIAWGNTVNEPIRIAACTAPDVPSARASLIASLRFVGQISPTAYRDPSSARSAVEKRSPVQRVASLQRRRSNKPESPTRDEAPRIWGVGGAIVIEFAESNDTSTVNVDCGEYATDSQESLADELGCCENDPGQCPGWNPTEFWEGEEPPFEADPDMNGYEVPANGSSIPANSYCYGRMDNIHISHTVANRVNFHARTWCDLPALVLEVHAVLQEQRCLLVWCWWGIPEQPNASLTAGSGGPNSRAETNSSHSCAMGRWYRGTAFHAAVIVPLNPINIGRTERRWHSLSCLPPI